MPNKRDKVWSSANLLFKWCFRSLRRPCCLSSLKSSLPRRRSYGFVTQRNAWRTPNNVCVGGYLKRSLKKVTLRWFKLYCAYFISLLKFVKCWQFFLESNSKSLYRNSGKEKESSLLFTSSTKREITHFRVVVVQWRERYVQKSVMHVQSCCFANLSQLLFCRSSWRRCRRCLRYVAVVRWSHVPK